VGPEPMDSGEELVNASSELIDSLRELRDPGREGMNSIHANKNTGHELMNFGPPDLVHFSSEPIDSGPDLTHSVPDLQARVLEPTDLTAEPIVPAPFILNSQPFIDSHSPNFEIKVAPSNIVQSISPEIDTSIAATTLVNASSELMDITLNPLEKFDRYFSDTNLTLVNQSDDGKNIGFDLGPNTIFQAQPFDEFPPQLSVNAILHSRNSERGVAVCQSKGVADCQSKGVADCQSNGVPDCQSSLTNQWEHSETQSSILPHESQSDEWDKQANDFLKDISNQVRCLIKGYI